MLDRHFSRFAGNEINSFRRRIGMIQIEGRRRNLVAQRKHREDRFQARRRRRAGVRSPTSSMLPRRSSGPEHRFDRGNLAEIADRRRGRGGVEMLDIDRRNRRLAQRDFDRAPGAVAAFGGRRSCG